MKYFALLLILLFAINSTYANNFNFTTKVNLNTELNSAIIAAQPVSVNLNCTPVITPTKSDLKLQSKADTLNDVLSRTTGATVYGVTIQGTTFPLTGYNPLYYLIGQKFSVNKNVKINEVLFSVAGKMQLGTYADTLRIMVFQGDPQSGLPTTQLSASGIKFVDIDTNMAEPIFTAAKFEDDSEITGKFVIMLFTFNGTQEYDALFLNSNMQGDGKNKEEACVIFNNNGNLATLSMTNYYSQLGLTMQDGNPPNMDVLLFPIVEAIDNGINDKISINGLTIESVGPIPANDKLNLQVNLDKASYLTVKVIDNLGNTVSNTSFDYLNSGSNNIEVNLNNLVSGTYYYLIETEYSHFGAKFNVVK